MGDVSNNIEALRSLLAGEIASVGVDADGRWITARPWEPHALLSGSFNPLHLGHEGMAAAAAKRLGRPVAFELPLLNADKPPLEPTEIERRLRQFTGRHTVWLTRAPLFHQKAALFPGGTFVIGYDTAARLIEPRYYDGLAGRDTALATTREHGCRFLVAARLHQDRLHTLADLRIEPAWHDLFVELPADEFRLDVSSTQIRAARSHL